MIQDQRAVYILRSARSLPLLADGGFEPELCEHGETAAIRFPALRGDQNPMRMTAERMTAEFAMTALAFTLPLLAEGLNFAELVTRHRVEVAKRMLGRPKASLQETAYEMGFASVTSFHRAFTRWTGMTPKEYQDSF